MFKGEFLTSDKNLFCCWQTLNFQNITKDRWLQHFTSQINTQFYQNIRIPNRTNKDIGVNPVEFGLGLEKFLAAGLVLICCNRCGCNRLVVITLVVVIAKVSVVVTIFSVDKLVSDLERASRLTGSEITSSGLICSEITGLGPTRSEMIGLRGF